MASSIGAGSGGRHATERRRSCSAILRRSHFLVVCQQSLRVRRVRHTNINTVVQAAAALQPLAGAGAKYLFSIGVMGVAMLAVPIMMTGAAYHLVQGLGYKGSLQAQPRDAKLFYGIIGVVAIDFLVLNPMRMLVWSGIVQGFSVPPLLLPMMLITDDRAVLGDKTNSHVVNVLGWGTVAVTFLAAAGLIVTWIV